MAIRITKVYTRTGDKGFTKLVGGKKVAKDATRIESYGTIDELNSVLGLARVFNDDLKDRLPAAKRLDEIFRRLALLLSRISLLPPSFLEDEHTLKFSFERSLMKDF